MPPTDVPFRQSLIRESLLDLGLFLGGIVLLPAGVFIVGRLVFGTYEGDGYGSFYGGLLERIVDGNGAAWFLVLSPLLLVLVLRFLRWGWRFLAADGR